MESLTSYNGSDEVSRTLANWGASRDQQKIITGLFERLFKEKVGFSIEDEDSNLMAHIGTQVLAEGDPDKFVANLILGNISPVDLILLRTASQQIPHDQIYDDLFESSHKILDLWEKTNKIHRPRIEATFE
jgi:hypothetical protein